MSICKCSDNTGESIETRFFKEGDHCPGLGLLMEILCQT